MKRSLESTEREVPPAKRRRVETSQKIENDVDEDYKCSNCQQSFDPEIGVKIYEGLKHKGPCCCLTCGQEFQN